MENFWGYFAVIIPGYGLTATERVLPRMEMDFTTALLDSRVSLTRALNTATRVNSSGLIELINADTPRFDYAASSLLCQGLLVEETRANLVINSSLAGTGGIDPTSWLRLLGTNGAQATSTIAAAGTSSAWTFTAANNRQIVYQTISVAANTTYYASIYVESNASSLANTQIFNVTNAPAGTTITYPATTTTAGSRLIIAIQVGATAGSVQFRFGSGVSSNITATVRLSCPQLEVGGFASSYIPTTTTSVTRNADVAVMTGANFSGWWTATSGAVVAQAIQRAVSGTSPWFQMDDNTANNIIALRGNTTNPELYIKATTDQATIDAGTIAANTVYRLGGTWTTDNCAAAVAGGAAVTDPSATIPAVTQARLGSDGTNYLNGWLQAVSFWPQRLTDAEIQAFSKGP